MLYCIGVLYYSVLSGICLASNGTCGKKGVPCNETFGSEWTYNGKCCNGKPCCKLLKAPCVPETCPMDFRLLANQANSADCYFYGRHSTESWEKAKLICASTPGAYLWRPNTIQEANIVRDQIIREHFVWTGANDRDKDGNYIFDIENSPFSKTSLPFGLGSFRNEAELVYVDIQYDYNFVTWLWENQNSNYLNRYLCEYQRVSILLRLAFN
ncbi:unnamed protein product [Mytilus edulis]|uniref:C-type lectin domain-containing protein n=1 Tax=Mytilus edulis TaxID=6550 RepID=A0A8S3QEW2_MYTED|nr:unnamed protein product [Mytilus edulis]